MLITDISFKNKIIRLCDSESNPNENTYTVVIGRNGSGKSTLLQKICFIQIANSFDNKDRITTVKELLDYSEREDINLIDETGEISYRTCLQLNE